MSEWAKVLAAKLDNSALIWDPHAEGENRLLQVVLFPPHMLALPNK